MSQVYGNSFSIPGVIPFIPAALLVYVHITRFLPVVLGHLVQGCNGIHVGCIVVGQSHFLDLAVVESESKIQHLWVFLFHLT